MILLADEDIGTHVPRALTLVGRDARSLFQVGWSSRPDPWWLEKAGGTGWLVFSANTAKMFTGTIDGMERRLSQEIEVLSHSQIVLGDHVITTLLVRRSGVSGDLRRN